MKITKNQNMQMKFFINGSLYLGGGFSLILYNSSTDSWLAIILGYLLGIGILYIFTKTSNLISNSLTSYLQKKNFINVLLKIVLFLFYLTLIFVEIIIVAKFIYSYFLPNTNIFVSALPFLFLVIYLAGKDILAIARVSQVLFFILVAIISLTSLVLMPYINFKNLNPILITAPKNIFISAIIFATLSTTPYLIMLDEKTDFKTNLKVYSASSYTILLIISLIILSFGPNLIKTFAYPEYTILRQISIFNFLENIENFIALSWFFNIFITMAVLTNKFKNLLKIKNNKIMYFIITLIFYIAFKFVMSDYIITIYVYKYLTPVFLIFSILIYLLFFIKKVISKPNGKYK